MKIVVLTGTAVKGVTYRMKEIFLSSVKDGNDIAEFTLPTDMPEFCTGCKGCFLKGEDKCPHAKYTLPIWDALMEADLIVLAYPVYALRAPGSVKALLDHLCVHWTVHRPKKEMRSKRVAILTNSIGAPNGAAQKDVATSFTWMGVSDIKRQGFGLMEDVFWDKISDERRRMMEDRIQKFAQKCLNPIKRSSLKTAAIFFMCKQMHQSGYRKALSEDKTPLLDDLYWAEQAWISK